MQTYAKKPRLAYSEIMKTTVLRNVYGRKEITGNHSFALSLC